MTSSSRVLVLVSGLAITACGGDGDPPAVDAPPGDSGPHDAALDASSNACTGQLYDPCTDNTQCMSGQCRNFNNLGVMLCTQACTPGGAACPTQGSAAVQCVANSQVCRPGMANSCTRP